MMGNNLDIVDIGSEFTSEVQIYRPRGYWTCAYEDKQGDLLLKCWGQFQEIIGGETHGFGANPLSPVPVDIAFPRPPPPALRPTTPTSDPTVDPTTDPTADPTSDPTTDPT